MKILFLDGPFFGKPDMIAAFERAGIRSIPILSRQIARI